MTRISSVNQVDFQFSEDISNKRTNKKPFSLSGGDQISPISKFVNDENKCFSLSSSVLENEIFKTNEQKKAEAKPVKTYNLKEDIQHRRQGKGSKHMRISENTISAKSSSRGEATSSTN